MDWSSVVDIYIYIYPGALLCIEAHPPSVGDPRIAADTLLQSLRLRCTLYSLNVVALPYPPPNLTLQSCLSLPPSAKPLYCILDIKYVYMN